MISKKKRTPDLLASCLMLSVLLTLSLPRIALAQRDLHWDRLDVEARLDAAGRLHVTETQSMVFTGYWNGGERTFKVRPPQMLSFTGISRVAAGGLLDLRENRTLSSVDDYAWTDARTLRWRSRLLTDPPFARTAMTYVLRYQLSRILVRKGDEYRLDYDFAFPDRAGTIDRFNLRLTLDSAWQPLTGIQEVYATSGLEPGRVFVLRSRSASPAQVSPRRAGCHRASSQSPLLSSSARPYWRCWRSSLARSRTAGSCRSRRATSIVDGLLNTSSSTRPK